MKNKAEVLWALLCSSSSIDSETNNVSLTNIIEELTLGKEAFASNPEKIDLAVNFQIVSLIKKISGDKSFSIDIKLKLIDPNGTELNTVEYPVEMQADKQRMRQRINLPALTVTIAGEYRLEMLLRQEGEEKFEKGAYIPLITNIK